MSDDCCPLCHKDMPVRNARLLYGTQVCKKCYYGFTNRRQLAYIIDAFAWWPIAWVLSFVANMLLGVVISTQNSNLMATLVVICNIILGWLMLPILFGLKDGFSGKSLGKLICGVQVVDLTTHQPISFNQAFKRNLVLLIPLVPIFIAFTLAKGRRFGDQWANTKVIHTKYLNHPIFTGQLACEACQYNLTGNTSGYCPECGHTISQANLERLNSSAVPPTVLA